MFTEFVSRNAPDITFWIAVLSFLMSLTIWIREFIVNRRRFDVHILGWCSYSTKATAIISISNKSRLPVTITDIRIILNNKLYPCVPVPKQLILINSRRNNQIYKTTERCSTELPESIPGLGGRQLYVLFEDLPDTAQILSSSLMLEVCSNRGRPKKMKFSHIKVLPDLKTLFQL